MKATSIILFNAFVLLLAITACKKTEDHERVKSFHITGIVYDKETHTPLDSVSVSLGYTTWFSPTIPVVKTKTTEDGTFEFDYTINTEEEYLYNVQFDKMGYNWTNEYVDSYIIDQSFVIQMEKY